MTLSSSTARNDYTVSVFITYPYTFKIFDEEDLVVAVRDQDTGAETTLELTTHYTVSGVRSATGGDVTLLTGHPGAVGDHITIRRLVDLTQETDIRNQGRYSPELHENEFDKLVMIDQQQQEQLDRSMRLPATYDPDDVSVELPNPVGGKALAWNSGASALVNANTTPIESVSTLDPLDSGDAEAADLVHVHSDSADDDRSMTLDDLRGALSRLGGVFDVTDPKFGAKSTNTAAANTTIINTAITAAAAAGGGTVRIPPGVSYNVSDLETDPDVDIAEESRAAPRRLRMPRPLLPGPTPIEIIGHRGAATLAPENTLASFSAAAGIAHSVEWDTQVSSDGELVVIHDATVDRTTDGTGDVDDMTLAELQALDAGTWFDARFAGALIPTLEDVLAYCGPRFRTLYPEIKGYRSTADIALMVQAIIDAGLEDRCVLQAFVRPTDFPFVRALSSRITLGYTVNTLTAWNDEIDDAEADGNAVLIADYTILTASMVADARSRGVDVVAWTVDTADAIRQMAAIGVTRIMTNMPRRAPL